MTVAMKHKDSIGLGVIEIILAIAIMMIITPAVLKYSFKELYEVKYINIAKQLKQIEKSLLNYAAIEKQNWSNGASGTITKDVRSFLVSNYGLDDTISPDITNDMRIKYSKDAEGVANVFAVLNLDELGLDEMEFKQTLLYAGDTVGFKEDNNAYSVTGAWSEPFANISENINGTNIVVIKIDDTNLENEYSSSNYLYRNNQGGAEGNKMRVNLSLGGYNINNFGTIEASNLKSSTNDAERVSEIRFNNGMFEGSIDVISSVILKGLFLFATNAYMKTPRVEISYLSDSFSVLKELIAENAKLQNASSSSSGALSFHSNIVVEGISTLNNLVVQNMQMSNLGPNPDKYTPLSISPRQDTKLRMEIAANDIDELYTQTITIKNGHIMNTGGCFSSSEGALFLKRSDFSGFNIMDACHTPISKTNPNGCDGRTLNKINLQTFMSTFNSGLSDLSRRINNM